MKRLLLLLSVLGPISCASGSGDDVCQSISCEEHGHCVEMDGRAVCLCETGYVFDGEACITDPCLGAPCVFGTCHPDGRNAICDCDPGYAGALCDVCAPGYRVEGLTCVEGSPCQDDPCVYGVCHDEGGKPVCDCEPGYTGAICDDCAPGYHADNLRCVSDTPCDPDPCAHGSCQVEGGEAHCACDVGYQGDRCEACATDYHEEGLICVPDRVGPCDPNPCADAHRSICQVDGSNYLCHCDPGYHLSDDSCVADTVCAPNPCTEANRSTCSDDGQGGFVCQCDAGFHQEGADCVADSTCLPNPCQVVNRSVCQDDGQGLYTCLCDVGYHIEDDLCLLDSACSPNPCQELNKTVCTIDGAGYVCSCQPGSHDEGGVCVVDSSCDPQSTCAGHGSCTGVGLECDCDLGYAGAHCDQCESGYHDDGGSCVADTACEPNPCTTLHQTVCSLENQQVICLCDAGYQDQDGNDSCLADCDTAALLCSDHGVCAIVLGQATCACDSGYTGAACADCATGYQDHDNDGSCRPNCDTAGLDCQGLVCDDSGGEAICEGARACGVTLAYDPDGEQISALYIRGEFNDWTLTHPLVKQADGIFRISLDLPMGDYAYKLYDQGRDLWFEDAANPYFKWVDGSRNSRLRVADCDQPLMLLTATPEVQGGDVFFQALYIDGAQEAGADAASVQVTRNGLTLAGTFDASAGTFTIDDTGLAAGKHTYRLHIADLSGRPAEELYVPVWVEEKEFQWQDAVLYFALTDRFADGDAGNNAPVADVDFKANWQGGDFAGLKAKIEEGYFDDLGVNAIWISSISENTAGAGKGMGSDWRKYSAYHSYWPISTGWRDGHEFSGLHAADPHFGSLAEFKELVQAAHARGIRILVDLVANHVHSDSPLWQDHQGAEPPWFHDLYTCGWDQPINCWFTDYLPDFEYKNLEVMNEVVEHAIWMIQETDVDGFRLDAVKHMIDDFSYAIRARIDESVSTTGLRFYMVGETFTGEGEGAADLIKHYVRPEMLDGQFDFPLYWQVVKTFLREEQDFRGLEGMLQWNQSYYGDWAVMSNFLGNHDVCRALSHANGDIADMWGNGSKDQGWDNPPGLPAAVEPFQRLRMAWTFLMTIPGVPLIYYGDEYGMPGAGDPDNRRFMQFDAELAAAQLDTLAHVRSLTAARLAHPCFRYGVRSELHMDDDGLVWAYGLTDGSDRAVVVFNRRDSSQTRSFNVGGLGLTDGTRLRDVLHDTTLTVSGGSISVTLGARDSAVWVLD